MSRAHQPTAARGAVRLDSKAKPFPPHTPRAIYRASLSFTYRYTGGRAGAHALAARSRLYSPRNQSAHCAARALARRRAQLRNTSAVAITVVLFACKLAA